MSAKARVILPAIALYRTQEMLHSEPCASNLHVEAGIAISFSKESNGPRYKLTPSQHADSYDKFTRDGYNIPDYYGMHGRVTSTTKQGDVTGRLDTMHTSTVEYKPFDRGTGTCIAAAVGCFEKASVCAHPCRF
jgi:hypothetical protein